MSHRLFFGIRPPVGIRDALLDLMSGMDNARWQDDDQLHLTLRFIGDVEAHVADDIAEATSRLRFSPCSLAISGLGTFERKGVPSAVWAAIKPSEPLSNLQRKIERICQQCGIEAETRKFVPHITLARLNQSTGAIAPFLARNGRVSLGPWQVEEFVLFESTLRPQGSLYEAAVTYPAEVR